MNKDNIDKFNKDSEKIPDAFNRCEEIEEVELCNYKSSHIDVHVRAYIKEGCLTIEGQDLGEDIEKFWGDIDYEYWYVFDENATEMLFLLLTKSISISDKILLKALRHYFSGIEGCKKLRNFCDNNQIQYEFYNYI